ncbi:Hypothetical protein A7982_10865 [Minicystis rosea]|nr:Hypothetical protein A7982_10865 [Minicystis rosea]
MRSHRGADHRRGSASFVKAHHAESKRFERRSGVTSLMSSDSVR